MVKAQAMIQATILCGLKLELLLSVFTKQKIPMQPHFINTFELFLGSIQRRIKILHDGDNSGVNGGKFQSLKYTVTTAAKLHV